MENQSKDSNALNLGDRGARIQELHLMLESLGFAVAEPFDCFTDETKNSIMIFQEQRGLPISGECDQKTWDVLVENSYILGDRLQNILQTEMATLSTDKIYNIQKFLMQLKRVCDS